MPLFDYICKDCKHQAEHFTHPGAALPPCPKCKSLNYKRKFASFRVNVEYANTDEYLEKKFNPEMEDIYRQIGKDVVNEDSKTLDNLFGEEKVRFTYGEEE